MSQIAFRRDAFALGILAVLLVLLGAGLTGAYRVFGYALVGLIGMFAGLGFIRAGDRRTWWPPVLVTAVLLVSFTGMFAYEAVPVNAPADTVLGFQPGTAFLVYGVWLPSFFTLGLSFALLFDSLVSDETGRAARKDGRQ
jgi:hypothetical protein